MSRQLAGNLSGMNGTDGEDALGDRGDRGDGAVGISSQKGTIGGDEQVIALSRHGVERMASFQPDTRQEIAAPLDRAGLRPDLTATGHQAGFEHCFHFVLTAVETPFPERGLQDVVESRRDVGVGDVVFPYQAQDRRVQRREIDVPVRQSLLPIFGLLSRDLWKGPCLGVVDDIVDELIETAARPSRPFAAVSVISSRTKPLSISRDFRSSISSSHWLGAFRVIVEDWVENQALDIDIGAAGAADDVLEL